MEKHQEILWDDSRHFANKIEPYEEAKCRNNLWGAADAAKQELTVFMQDLYKHIISVLKNHERTHFSNDSVYIGKCGAAYMQIKMSELLQNEEDKKQTLKEALSICDKVTIGLSSGKARRGGRRVTFLEGESGVYALMSVIYAKLHEVKMAEKSLALINDMHDYVLGMSENECEILYGKCGYIYSLLYTYDEVWKNMNKHIKYKITTNIFTIVSQVITMGKKNHAKATTAASSSSLPSLYYEWFEEPYLGGAHGLAGIYLCILQAFYIIEKEIQTKQEENVESNINNEELFVSHLKISRNDLLKYIRTNKNLVYNCVVYVIENYTFDSSSNIMPSIPPHSSAGGAGIHKTRKTKNKDDKLVHWCHGAPAFVPLLLFMHFYPCEGGEIEEERHKTEKNIYLQKAEELSEEVWMRGLLKKGVGLCHGISGNAYVFLSMYKATKNEKYLYYAIQFAYFAYKNYDLLKDVPDTKYSLFEGSAGFVVFLADLIFFSEKNSFFIGYEIPL